MSLTDASIKAAKPREKRYTMFDSGGLYLEVSPAGGKWWRLRYTVDKKIKVKSLGTYPTVSLKAARAKRDEIKTNIANGVDIKNDNAILFKQVCTEWLELKKSKVAESSYRSLVSKVNKYLLPVLAEADVSSIKKQDFLDIAKKIEANGNLVQARNVSRVCYQIMHYAQICDYVQVNQAEHLTEVLLHSKVKHMAALLNEAEIGKLLYDIRISRKIGYIVKMALCILPYVFVRINELLKATWDEINFDTATWTIPAERMKRRHIHTVPLAKQVVELFMELKNTDTTKSKYCFPAGICTKPISSVIVINALRRLGYTSEQMSLHGFRTIASTILNEHGFRADVIELQLSHVDKNVVRAAYNRSEYLSERRTLMQWYADYLDNLVTEAKKH